MGRNPVQTQSGSWINAEGTTAYQPGTTGNLMPSGIPTQPLTLCKAPGKGTETTAHATNCLNTVQANYHPVSPCGIHSISSLTNRSPVVIIATQCFAIPQSEGKHCPSPKAHSAGIICIFPFKWAAPIPETGHPTSQTNNPT